MDERDQPRNAVVAQCVWDALAGEPAANLAAVAAELDAIRSVVRQLRLGLRNPDHVQAVAVVGAAAASITRRPGRLTRL